MRMGVGERLFTSHFISYFTIHFTRFSSHPFEKSMPYTRGQKRRIRPMIRFCVSSGGTGDDRTRRFEPFSRSFLERRFS